MTDGRSLSRAPKLTPNQREAAVGEYMGGASSDEVAARYGIHRHSVENLLKTRGILPRHIRPRFSPEERAARRIRRLYLTASDAAAELGISRFTMLEYLRDGKLPGAFQIGERARFWLVPRAAVEERKRARKAAAPRAE